MHRIYDLQDWLDHVLTKREDRTKKMTTQSTTENTRRDTASEHHSIENITQKNDNASGVSGLIFINDGRKSGQKDYENN